jgi:hypothetical protein
VGVVVPLEVPLVAAGAVGLPVTGSPFPGVLFVVQPKAASDADSDSATSARVTGRSFKFLVFSALRM